LFSFLQSWRIVLPVEQQESAMDLAREIEIKMQIALMKQVMTLDPELAERLIWSDQAEDGPMADRLGITPQEIEDLDLSGFSDVIFGDAMLSCPVEPVYEKPPYLSKAVVGGLKPFQSRRARAGL
jgi:hypothetical protein